MKEKTMIFLNDKSLFLNKNSIFID